MKNGQKSGSQLKKMAKKSDWQMVGKEKKFLAQTLSPNLQVSVEGKVEKDFEKEKRFFSLTLTLMMDSYIL